MSNVNAPESIAFESPKARGLLAALANLVKPMVYECMASDTPHTQPAADEIGSTSSGQSPEHEFVKCLKGFIAETVEECRMTELLPFNSSPNPTVTSPSVSLIRVNLNITEDSSRPRVIPAQFRQVFKDYVLKRICDKVSTMPTRLLAFDSTGSQICLVDHREAVMFLVESICADMDNCNPDFVASLIHHLRRDPSGEFLTRRDDQFISGTLPKKALDKFMSKYTRYMILSHTWTKDSSGEISYQDWHTRELNPGGYEKIRKFCEVSAQNHNFRLGWIDTCCINKESSAELDEALRSMYKWYQNAALCLVYLSETLAEDDISQDSWFMRGWTLQELVAPRKMAAYSKHWTILPIDQAAVAATAGIKDSEIRVFQKGHQDNIPISRRFQMASGRRVTREEDRAYSLMGILDVSIPIAYGEGSRRAFSRLMREVINSKRCIMDIFNRSYSPGSTDIIPITVDVYQHRSDAFKLDFPNMFRRPLCKLEDATPIEPFLLTHMGLRIHLLLVPGIKRSVVHTQLQPIGDLYGRVWDCILLEKSLFSQLNTDFTVTVFGVVNFSLKDGNVCIQNPSISVPLGFTGWYSMQTESYKVCHGRFTNATPSSPPIFTLESSKDPERQSSEITIPEDELQSHGLRLIMLYL